MLQAGETGLQSLRCVRFVADAMRRVSVHYDAGRRVFMEWAHLERGVDHSSMRGRLLNPGHSSMYQTNRRRYAQRCSA